LPPVFSRVSWDVYLGIYNDTLVFRCANPRVPSWFAKIDKNMYEAAKIDGASRWQILWKITMPVLAPLTFVNIIYTIVTLSTFATSPIVKKILVDMYRPERGLGYASALAWIYFWLYWLL